MVHPGRDRTLEQGCFDTGEDARMFNLPGVDEGKALIPMQELPEGYLKPNSTYIAWLRFNIDNPITMPVSAAVFGSEILPCRERHPAYRKPAP